MCSGYLLNKSTVCSDVKYILTLIVVNSVPGNFKQRQRMRSTIGNRTILPSPVRILFLLGTVLNGSLQNQLKAEHNIYGDTIQGDFLDTYINFTLKSALALKWITEYCQNTEFVIRLEDNTTVDIFYLLINILPAYIGSTKTIFCLSRVSDKAANVTNQWFTEDIRWFVSDTRFKTRPRYLLLNCVGYPAIISTDFIPILYLTSVHVPSDMNNMTFYDIKDDVGHGVSTPDHECFRRRQNPCLFISGPEEMLMKYWEYVYGKRYDFISTAVDNLDIFEGF
ncbi:hypothetical protein SNE40_012203 [Patella caerulea]|uniref:Hexosyltransferase n=1 Tax=Patella caerulea TaxID=87958 RepID=A0AAN8JPD0_PATCE